MRTSQFANYKLLDRLDDAPLGESYKAYNHDTKDVVSLLLLPEELGELSERDLQALLGDLRATADAKLAHHGLVHVVHVGCHEGRHYAEIEFVKGRPLSRYVEKKGPLTPEAASHMVRCIAEALNVAHGRSVFHRMVSPVSVVRLDDGEAKLGHFGMVRLVVGLRKLLGRKAEKLIAKEAMPDLAYLAPEQREGFVGDERSDIYGLGATLHFMLTGKRLDDLGQLPARGAAHPLYDLIRRMTDPDRKKRLPSCEEVLLDLDHLDDVPLEEVASAPSPKAPERKAPAEVGGDPSDTLLWDTSQLEAVRSKWTEDKPFPESQERTHPPEGAAPPPDAEKGAEEGVAAGYQPAFQPLVIDDSGPKKSIQERSRELAVARRRANLQLVFGIALNLVLFIIAMWLALPLINRYMSSSASPPEKKSSGPREIGQPEERPALSSPRPKPIRRETDDGEKAEPDKTVTTKTETPPEPPKAAPVTEKESSTAPAKEKEETAPAKTETDEPKPAPEKKTPQAKKDPAEKDSLKSDLMKDEKPSYYDDPNWAKKGKTTVRIIIPGWHKKDGESEEKSEDSNKSKSDKSKKDSKTEPAPEQPATEK